jgi:outer membrane protease
MMNARLQAIAALIVIQGAQHAAAEEQFYEISDTVRIGGGAGYTFINSDEIVYDGAGDRISHLLWQSQAPVVTGSIEAEFANGWTLRAGGSFAAAGNSHMEDYDWLDPYFVSYDFDDWTHRSVHPDTRLAHYFSGDIAVGRDLPLGPAATLNLHAGLKYTDVRWNAYGGSFVYSITGYRADTFSVPDGTPGISFQQRYPGIFLGASLAARHGPWSFSGQARGGVSIRATDTDHHWARDLRFEERYGAIPFVTAAARVDYAFNDRTSVFLGGDFQQYFHAVGDSTIYDIPTGAQGPTSMQAAGMTLRAISVSGGFRMKF